MRRVTGYAATGSVREQCLFVWYGRGANGKSTFADAISCALGDYAGLAPPDLLISSGNARHPTEMADLLGRRFVSCSESGEGRRFDEARVKTLTGEQRVKARVMRGDFFEFDASHKLILMTNHKPEVHGTDHGIWRRIKLIPFIETISAEERDADLPQRLAAERDGILPWIVRGAQEWLAGGLKDPAVVHRATADYRAAEDVVGRFLQEETATSDGSVECQTLYDHYLKWCQAKGEKQAPYKQLRIFLEERGMENGAHPKTRRAIWKNLSVPSLEVTGS